MNCFLCFDDREYHALWSRDIDYKSSKKEETSWSSDRLEKSWDDIPNGKKQQQKNKTQKWEKL